MYSDKGYMEKKPCHFLHLLNRIVQHEHSAKRILLCSIEESKSYRFGKKFHFLGKLSLLKQLEPQRPLLGFILYIRLKVPVGDSFPCICFSPELSVY